MRGACDEHVPMLSSLLLQRGRNRSLGVPKVGPSNGFSSLKLFNLDAKQANGEAEPVHRGDGRQRTGRGKLHLPGYPGSVPSLTRVPATGKEKGLKRCHGFWWWIKNADHSCLRLRRVRASCSRVVRPRSCVAFHWFCF